MTAPGMLIILAIKINTPEVVGMKTIQMTLDENLVKEVDQVVKQLRMNRSALPGRHCGRRSIGTTRSNWNNSTSKGMSVGR